MSTFLLSFLPHQQTCLSACSRPGQGSPATVISTAPGKVSARRNWRGEGQVRYQQAAGLTSTFFQGSSKEDGSFPQRPFGNGDGFVPSSSHPGRRHRGSRSVFWGARVDL